MITIPAHDELFIEDRDNDTYFIVVDGSGWLLSICPRNGRYLKKGDMWIFKKGRPFGFRTETESLTVEMRIPTRADEEAYERLKEEREKPREGGVFDPLFDPIRAKGVPPMLTEREFIQAVWKAQDRFGAG